MQTMTLVWLRDRAIEEGIKSVNETEKNPVNREGALEGFERCRTLLTLEEYDAALKDRNESEWALRGKHEALRDETAKQKALDDYWRYRWGTLQIEWMKEIIKCGLRQYPLSGRAMMTYHRILSEAGNGG